MRDEELKALAEKANNAHGIRVTDSGQFRDPLEIEAFDKVSIAAVLSLLARIAALRKEIATFNLTSNIEARAKQILAADDDAQS